MTIHLLASLLASGAFAAQPLPEIPDRNKLWETDAYEKSLSTEPLSGLPLDVMLNGKTMDERGRGVFLTRNSLDHKQPDGELFWHSIDVTIDALNAVLDSDAEDPAFRRFSVALVFGGGLAPQAKERIQTHPLEAGGIAAWNRLDALRQRCLKDKDAALNEFFERYRSQRPGPDWKRAKAESRTLQKRLLRRFPDRSKDLKEFWSQIDKTEGHAHKEYKEFPAIQGLKKLPKKAQARLRQTIKQTYDYRIYSAYGNLYRRVMAEQFGAEALDKARVKVLPVKLGWPEFGFLAQYQR